MDSPATTALKRRQQLAKRAHLGGKDHIAWSRYLREHLPQGTGVDDLSFPELAALRQDFEATQPP